MTPAPPPPVAEGMQAATRSSALRETHVHMMRGWQNPRIEAEIEKKTGTGIIAGTMTEIVEETGIATGTRRGIATVGIPVKERNTETVLMIVIIKEAGILIGEETVREMGIGGIVLAHDLVQGADIADLGLVQEASELVGLMLPRCNLWLLRLLLCQPQQVRCQALLCFLTYFQTCPSLVLDSSIPLSSSHKQ
jgi:hypothetical protein